MAPPGDPAESENRRHDRDHEEHGCPVKHIGLLSVLGHAAEPIKQHLIGRTSLFIREVSETAMNCG